MHRVAALAVYAQRLALALVLAALFALPALAQAPAPAPAPAPVPAPASSGWFSPEGLNVALTFVVLVGMPLAALLARKLGFSAAADKIEAHRKDAESLRGALVSTVRGVERFRKLTSLEVGKDLAKIIEDVSRQDSPPGTGDVLAAVVAAVTAPGAVVPAVAHAATPDPIVDAVRRATGRLEGGRVA